MVKFFLCGSSPGSPTNYADHSGLTHHRYYGVVEIQVGPDQELRYRLWSVVEGRPLLVFGVEVAAVHASNSFGLGRGSHKVRVHGAYFVRAGLASDAKLEGISQVVGLGKHHEEDKAAQKEDNRDAVVGDPWGLGSWDQSPCDPIARLADLVLGYL